MLACQILANMVAHAEMKMAQRSVNAKGHGHHHCAKVTKQEFARSFNGGATFWNHAFEVLSTSQGALP